MPARAPEEEGDFGEIGNDRDAVSALQQPVGNALIACVADVVERLRGEEEASFLQRLRVCGNGRERERDASESR